MRVDGKPVPGLIRDLRAALGTVVAGRGPGAGPGRGLPILYPGPPSLAHGAVRLYNGVTTLRGDLCRSDRQPSCAGGSASSGAFRAYREIRDSDAGLVRVAQRFRDKLAARTGHQALAARVEECADRRAQSELAGCDGAYSDFLKPCPGLDPGPRVIWRASVGQRSRVKPGTGVPFGCGRHA